MFSRGAFLCIYMDWNEPVHRYPKEKVLNTNSIVIMQSLGSTRLLVQYLNLFSHLWIFADFINDVRCGYDPPTRHNSTNHCQSADDYWMRLHVIRDLTSLDQKTGTVRLTTEIKMFRQAHNKSNTTGLRGKLKASISFILLCPDLAHRSKQDGTIPVVWRLSMEEKRHASAHRDAVKEPLLFPVLRLL